MTDYVPYTPDEYAPDAPGTALHFQRWFENWIAGFEGAPGAPRLDLGALARIVPGDVIKNRLDAVQTTNQTTTTAHSLAFLQAGTVRVTFEHRINTGSGGSVVVRRVRNGSPTNLATFSHTTSFVARSVDCPVEPGDLIEIRHTGNLSGSAETRNMRFQNDGANLWPGFAFTVEGNTYA